MTKTMMIFRRISLLALVLAIGASLANASSLLTCNNGTNTTCTFWVDIFSNTLTQTSEPNAATAATLVAPNSSPYNVSIPQWDTTVPGHPSQALTLLSVSFVVDWAATATVSVENDDTTSSHSFTNAFVNTPISLTVAGNTSNVFPTPVSQNVNGSVNAAQTVTVPTLNSTTGNDSAYRASQENFFLNVLGIPEPGAHTDAELSTANHCTTAYSSGGQNSGNPPSSYDSSTDTCTNEQTGTTTNTNPTVTAFGATEGTGTYNFSSGNLGLFESANPVNFSASAASGDNGYGGNSGGCVVPSGPGAGNPCLHFGGTGTAGGILEVTYTAQLETIPEPVTLVLVGGALLGIGVIRRRKMAGRS